MRNGLERLLAGCAALTVVSAACTCGWSRPKTPLGPTVTLAALGVTVHAPAGYTVVQSATGAKMVEAGTRRARSLALDVTPVPMHPPFETAKVGTGVVRFGVRPEPGGSGGPVEFLEGSFELGGRTFLVTCTDAGETSRDATWCFDVLETARPTGGGGASYLRFPPKSPPSTPRTNWRPI